MAVVNINTDQVMLEPGDIVKFVYALGNGNPLAINAAISQIKQTLAHDPRFNYQGSENAVVQDTDDQGNAVDVQVINIYVQVAKLSTQAAKKAGYAAIDTADPQNVWVGENCTVFLVIALVALVGMLTVATLSHESTLRERQQDRQVNGINASKLPDYLKSKALDIVKGQKSTSLSDSIKGLTSDVGIIAVTGGIILLLLHFSGRKGSAGGARAASPAAAA